jgi:HAE1 family hydrophobic/amphiphilic exporter-1
LCFWGLLAINQLPISQFPQIAPTTVNIFVAYPGSKRRCIDQINPHSIRNLPSMVYKECGILLLMLPVRVKAPFEWSFEPGTDPNEAVVRVKTRVDQVMPNLPDLVQREGRYHYSSTAQYAVVCGFV